MIKRFLCFFLALSLMFSAVYADGDGNMDGGGGGVGGQTSHGFWNPGNEGVRVSVVAISGRSVVATADFTNAGSYISTYANSIVHFGRVSKLAYIGGQSLSFKIGTYTSYPISGMPTIIATNGSNNISAIKAFFTKSETVRYIAETVGMNYDTLVGGDYKLLIEPMAYFKYEGNFFAITATEAALYDVVVSGQLKYWMGTVTHQNLPLSMYLEHNDDDLWLAAWTGSTSGRQSNSNILSYLGMGVVTFDEVEVIMEATGDLEYRTDTDVILSFSFQNINRNGGITEKLTPDSNAYLEINVGGTIYRKQFVCPVRKTQTVWIKWHTPDTPQTVEIEITSPSIPGLRETVYASIVDLEENPPPDPQYYDSNPAFSAVNITDYGSKTYVRWGEWNAYINDLGGWSFEYVYDSATLTTEFTVVPDSSVPTAYQVQDEWVMGSGYGVNVNAKITVTGITSDVTPAQNIVALFPEFYYTTYDRLLTTRNSTTSTYYNQKWTLKPNEYSFYNNPVHFTPLWYPDGEYKVEAVVIDVWTPGGMLYATVSDSVAISQTCIDDWYIGRTK